MRNNLLQLFDASDGSPSWRASNQSLFPSAWSLRWWWRRHQREAVDAGAAVLVAGRWHVIEPKFSRLVLAIAKRDAKRAAGVCE